MALVGQLQYLYKQDGDGNPLIIVFVEIVDDGNGTPQNGGNITIYYDQQLGTDAMGTHESVIVPGQSKVIYNGANGDGYSWVITGSSDIPPPPPPIGVCDLIIQSITINQPESASGANDASITVVASSSYGAIQYSLDNITFQTSPIFTGISGGVKTVYTTDTNPATCTAQKNVTIPILTNLVTVQPVVVLGGNTSRWNAAFNPIVFQYQRKDFEVTAASSYASRSVTGTTLAINGDMSILVALVAANVIAGVNATPIYIYVNTGAYKGVYQVIDATTSSVSINAAFTATSTGFMNSNNIKPYYKMITEIQTVDPTTGQASTIQSLNRPDATGLIKADISSYLQSILRAADKSDYSEVNYRDDNLSASYRIAYAESWDDGSGTGYTAPITQLPDTYYIVYAAKQLGQKYGGNLADFVPFKNLPANWVTEFKNPVYSLTFPFDIGFIYGEDLAGLNLYYVLTTYDINMNALSGGVVTGFLLNEDGSFLLNEDGSKFIISEVDTQNAPIVEHVGLNRLLVDYDFDGEVYYFKLAIFYNDDDDNPIQVLKDQICRVSKDCDYNSVYLRWIGLTGSWNYYRFIYNQEVTLDVQNSTVITRYVEDWENDDTIEDVIVKAAGQKVQVHSEDMSVDDIRGCQSIKYSPKVQMLASNCPFLPKQSGIKWQTIVVNTATFAEFESQLGQYQFALTFNMPSVNVQTQ